MRRRGTGKRTLGYELLVTQLNLVRGLLSMPATERLTEQDLGWVKWFSFLVGAVSLGCAVYAAMRLRG